MVVVFGADDEAVPLRVRGHVGCDAGIGDASSLQSGHNESSMQACRKNSQFL